MIYEDDCADTYWNWLYIYSTHDPLWVGLVVAEIENWRVKKKVYQPRTVTNYTDLSARKVIQVPRTTRTTAAMMKRCNLWVPR